MIGASGSAQSKTKYIRHVRLSILNQSRATAWLLSWFNSSRNSVISTSVWNPTPSPANLPILPYDRAPSLYFLQLDLSREDLLIRRRSLHRYLHEYPITLWCSSFDDLLQCLCKLVNSTGHILCPCRATLPSSLWGTNSGLKTTRYFCSSVHIALSFRHIIGVCGTLNLALS